jgi:DNA-binding MarR family transcriptional regulator
MSGYAEKIYVLVHHCHELCLKIMRTKKPDAEFSGMGISLQQGIILKLLLDCDGMTQKELTQRLQITSSSCGQQLVKLEQDGYLARRESSGDKRTFGVFLTEKGRGLGHAYKEKSVVALEKWASDLTEQEKGQLFLLLGKLKEGLAKQLSGED